MKNGNCEIANSTRTYYVLRRLPLGDIVCVLFTRSVSEDGVTDIPFCSRIKQKILVNLFLWDNTIEGRLMIVRAVALGLWFLRDSFPFFRTIEINPINRL